MSFTTFVWKASSRCNLNCKYCYVYNGGDSTWKRQPPYMSKEVAQKSARRIREYCEQQDLNSVNINLHGGEPFLGGLEHIEMLLNVIASEFNNSKVSVASSVQSNGLLFTEEIGEMLLRKEVGLYISLDGPAQINNLNRVNYHNQPTTAEVESTLKLLTSSSSCFYPIFQGFLSVINLNISAREVFNYLEHFNPPAIDFLLPLYNYDSWDRVSGQYAQWLIECFDYWFSKNSSVRVRTFELLMLRMLRSSVSTSVDGFESIIVETNGELEADDTLKTAYHGAAQLGLNVFNHSLGEVESSPALQNLRMATEATAECVVCPYYMICRGGHVSHRYSKERGFNNPSVYCNDLKAFIAHIHQKLVEELQPVQKFSLASEEVNVLN